MTGGIGYSWLLRDRLRDENFLSGITITPLPSLPSSEIEPTAGRATNYVELGQSYSFSPPIDVPSSISRVRQIIGATSRLCPRNIGIALWKKWQPNDPVESR
jgi:hypothetical protein